VGADVLHIGQLQAGQQLELSDACLDHLVVNIRAPRGHCRAGIEESSGRQGEARSRHKMHFQALLDASAAEDQQLAMTCLEEDHLKLAMQISLHDCKGQTTGKDASQDTESGSAMVSNQHRADPDFEQKIVLLKFLRPSQSLRHALLSASELADSKALLEQHDHTVELPSGAMVFVRPDHFKPLMDAIRLGRLQLYPEHVFVDPYLADAVIEAVRRLPRSAKVYCHGGVKRSFVPTGFATAVNELDYPVNVERTFIHVRVPSSLLSNRSQPPGPATA